MITEPLDERRAWSALATRASTSTGTAPVATLPSASPA